MEVCMNEFVQYLNGLHNYNAQNQNAYGERNVESPFYAKTMVPIEICDYIVKSIEENSPHIILLTGHAGDGKTSIMFQVLDRLAVHASFSEPIQDVKTDSGKEICCIKDFSELSDGKKVKILSEVLELPAKGKFVFMVANTGPLINTFGKIMTDHDKNEVEMSLIEAMDSNDGKIRDLLGYKLMVINIATIENTGFVRKYLEMILAPELWKPCECCAKKEYCHIFLNRNLIESNKERVSEFIEDYYIWQSEYGTRLTIRSMTEHIAYMMTGGDDCGNVTPVMAHEKLFSNLFFGFEGVISNPLADNVLAVRLAKESGLYRRRLRTDEELLIRRNYQHLFGKSLNEIINKVDTGTKLRKEFDNELRRMYLFMNISSDDQHKKDLEDIFSKQFLPFIMVRNHGQKPSKSQKNLVIDALRMIYLGTVISNNHTIPITMGTEGGITQSVQLIAGELYEGDIELAANRDSALNNGKNNLVLKIKKKDVCTLTLPMIDHFEELKNGVISTNMDPQLSYGIENLKSRLLELADVDEDKFDFLVMDNKGFTPRTIIIEDGMLTIQ